MYRASATSWSTTRRKTCSLIAASPNGKSDRTRLVLPVVAPSLTTRMSPMEIFPLRIELKKARGIRLTLERLNPPSELMCSPPRLGISPPSPETPPLGREPLSTAVRASSRGCNFNRAAPLALACRLESPIQSPLVPRVSPSATGAQPRHEQLLCTGSVTGRSRWRRYPPSG